ncbi:hypothetical protein CXF96_15405 [Stenotrophomonas sp. Betaine-02u-21]|nr:hypothetical protein CXF90_17080 [Stenotrophomonas sp. Betaine-02u-23]PKH72558.1 hypothetical protein CXF96_15405 [Stenotrophomonas sp. Betaine-02u-21]PKH96226.1 hypothetical protein CXG43_08755 [Stenotrophomonas sp. Bg11-02]
MVWPARRKSARAGQWLGEYSASGVPLQQVVWLENYPIAVFSESTAGVPTLGYVQPDHLGTPRVIIDAARNVAVWEWALTGEAFGADAANEDPDGDGVAFGFALRFPGQQATSETGLNYNYQRDYDAGVGRYVQSDPIGLLGGLSTYGYVEGDPLRSVDPLGLQVVGSPNEMKMWGQGHNIRSPDFVKVSVSFYVFGASRSFSRSGNTFVAGGLSRPYPSPNGRLQASLSVGWLNQCEVPTGAKVDDHLGGFGISGAGGYRGVGGGLNYSPNAGTSTEVGVGIGGGFSPGEVSRSDGSWGGSW